MKVIFTLGLMIFFLSNVSFSQTRPLIFGVLDIRPMMNIQSDQLEPHNPGLIIELLWLLEKHLDIKIEFRTCPAKRCFVMLGEGKIDGMPMASYSPERAKQFAAYPMKNGSIDRDRKIFDASYGLYKLKSSPLKWDGENLSQVNMPIGVNLGFSVAKFLKKQGVEVVENNSTVANMEMLLAERVSGVAVFKSLGDAILKRDARYNPIVMLPKPLTSKPYYMVLSHQFQKQFPDLAEDIWATAAKIGPSDEYRKIIDKYLH